MSDDVDINARVERISLIVEDVDAVADDLSATLGFSAVECVVAGARRAARTTGGYELVEADETAVPDFWAPPLATIVVSVDDVEEVRQRVLAAGGHIVDDTVVDGARELNVGRSLLNIPLTIRQR